MWDPGDDEHPLALLGVHRQRPVGEPELIVFVDDGHDPGRRDDVGRPDAEDLDDRRLTSSGGLGARGGGRHGSGAPTAATLRSRPGTGWDRGRGRHCTGAASIRGGAGRSSRGTGLVVVEVGEALLGEDAPQRRVGGPSQGQHLGGAIRVSKWTRGGRAGSARDRRPGPVAADPGRPCRHPRRRGIPPRIGR